ncbi:MAG: hypothetical protein ACE5KE_07375 [Methanosarcinales archaeon]
MRNAEQTNRIKVQTNTIPPELTLSEINETARCIALYYKKGEFIYQTFFTPPILGEINKVLGLETNADVYFREIHLIGPNLFRILLVGEEMDVRKMSEEPKFYKLLRGISTTYNETIRSRRYLETTTRKECWEIIVSLDKKTYSLLNYVKLKNNTIRIENIIILGDRLLGLTDKREVVWGQLTPDVLEKENVLLEVNLIENVNKLGKIDSLVPVPNSEDSFLVSIHNSVFQFNIWGEMIHFNSLEANVKRINSINFNNTRTILATTDGIYELDVLEMPNMIKATSLPRQIINPHLKDNFKVALYVEDPYILGIHPAPGVFAKTEKEEVLFF